MSSLNYFLLSDLHKPVQCKIVAIKGKTLPLALGLTDKHHANASTNNNNSNGNQSLSPSLSLDEFHDLTVSSECEIFVEARIASEGEILGTPAFTSYRRSSAIASSVLAAELTDTTITGVNTVRDTLKFSEWLSFPLNYPDLLPSAKLVITVWAVKHPHTHAIDTDSDTNNSAKNGTANTENLSQSSSITSSKCYPLGGTSMPLFNKRGLLKLGRRRLLLWLGQHGDMRDNSSTPYKLPANIVSNSVNDDDVGVSVARLESLIYRYDQKELPCDVKWLDKLALSRIAAMQVREQQAATAYSAFKLLNAATPDNSTGYPHYHPDLSLHLLIEFPSFPHPVVFFEKKYFPPLPPLLPFNDHDRLFVLHDPEIQRDNPVDLKYHKLSRSVKGMSDRDLKPKITERRQLDRIISSPVPRLTMDEKELLWKFRFSLKFDNRALTKFLRCVDWNDSSETNEALSLLKEWADIEISSALELLSSSFTNEQVRAYAVKQIERADDDEIASYLLQLVQALRYEPNFPSPLSMFLIHRCCTSLSLANFFYWYLRVEENDSKRGSMFESVLQSFLLTLRESEPSDRQSWHEALLAESKLMEELHALSEAINAAKGKTEKKIERMRLLLTSADSPLRRLKSFNEPVRMAVRPSELLTGIIGEQSTLFKSKLAPMLLCFSTPSKETYKVMYKRGDDLRQDQLIIQIINLMDALLKKVRLDLQLTPYRVLATSPTDGFVEYVPHSYTISSVLADYQSNIKKFLANFNQSPQQFNLAMENFIRSCAGYAVITYLLGIGDRHLDNVMLTTSGHLFHIDFSFIFGRDPKPFPPPIKIIKEMIEAMGGANSPQYMEFRQHCVSAYNQLRQHASLILNLLSLMANADIPDLSQDMEKNLLKTQDKFRLDLNDEQAGAFILAQVDSSVSLLFPQVMEKFHQIALYWK